MLSTPDIVKVGEFGHTTAGIVYKTKGDTFTCVTTGLPGMTSYSHDVDARSSMVIRGNLPEEDVLTQRLSTRESLSTLSLHCLSDVSNIRLELLLTRTPNLATLSLAKLAKVDDEGLIKAVKKVPGLRELYIGHIQSITDKGLAKAVGLLPKLHGLQLWYMPSITDAGLVNSLAACPSLESLMLWHIPRVSSKGLKDALAKASMVRKLTLRDMPSIKGADIHTAMQSVMYIRELVLKDLKELLDEDLYSILDRCKALERLELNCLGDLTGKGIAKALGNIRERDTLKGLTLDYMTNVSEKDLTEILEACPALTKLRLICLPRVRSLKKPLSRSSRSLEDLWLEHFHTLKVKQLKKILTLRPSIEKLSAYNLDSISKRELANLQLAFVGKVAIFSV